MTTSAHKKHRIARADVVIGPYHAPVIASTEGAWQSVIQKKRTDSNGHKCPRNDTANETNSDLARYFKFRS